MCVCPAIFAIENLIDRLNVTRIRNAQKVLRLMKIPFAKIKLRQHQCIGIGVVWLRPTIADDERCSCFFFFFFRGSSLVHALRSNREQHNYGDTCAFSITNSIHSKCFFFRLGRAIRCFAFWIKLKPKQYSELHT